MSQNIEILDLVAPEVVEINNEIRHTLEENKTELEYVNKDIQDYINSVKTESLTIDIEECNRNTLEFMKRRKKSA